jgi:hypothetical protein
MNQLHDLTMLIDALAALIVALRQLVAAIRRPP